MLDGRADVGSGYLQAFTGNNTLAEAPLIPAGLPEITFSAMANDPTGSTTASTSNFTIKLKIGLTRFDPLVLDYSSDGIDFMSVANDGSNSVSIDPDGDGSMPTVKSSWLNGSSSSDDYFLVYKNDNDEYGCLLNLSGRWPECWKWICRTREF